MHYLAACLVFKDAASYLDEWIRFHLRVGIEHFYFYDNGSDDDYEPVIRPFVDDGHVTLYKWPGVAQQNLTYQHCLDQHRGGYTGLLFWTMMNFFSPPRTPICVKSCRVTRIMRGSQCAGYSLDPMGTSSDLEAW